MDDRGTDFVAIGLGLSEIVNKVKITSGII